MPFDWLRSWWSPVALDHVAVVLYTRVGCHLCEDAMKEIEAVQRHYRFSFSVVDVDSSQDLVSQYGLQVPVVTVNGQVRFRGLLNRVLFTRLLRSESNRRPN